MAILNGQFEMNGQFAIADEMNGIFSRGANQSKHFWISAFKQTTCAGCAGGPVFKAIYTCYPCRKVLDATRAPSDCDQCDKDATLNPRVGWMTLTPPSSGGNVENYGVVARFTTNYPEHTDPRFVATFADQGATAMTICTVAAKKGNRKCLRGLC